jgi:YspA, cpYpsA-related SLOG family
MTGTYRILVTGSRTWDDGPAVWEALEAIHPGGRDLIVVHGACPWGADSHAAWWARVHGAAGGITGEPHPADWNAHGKRAGFIRNAEMVSLGANVCLAFLMPCTDPKCRRKEPHGSHGASHCAALAEKAGIPVRRFTPDGRNGAAHPDHAAVHR